MVSESKPSPRCLAIIPARVGSKSISHKNTAQCGGRPLIEWTLEAAYHSKLITSVIISTDDIQLLEARAFGDLWDVDPRFQFQERPATLAEDFTPTEAVIQNVLERIREEPEVVVLLQPTSPIRTGKQIDEAILQLHQEKADSLLSVVPSHSFLWHQEDEVQLQPGARIVNTCNYDFHRRPMRQEMEQWEENGSIYAFRMDHWERTHLRLGGQISLYEMPEESRIQVDSETDLYLVGKLLERQLVYAG